MDTQFQFLLTFGISNCMSLSASNTTEAETPLQNLDI